VASVPALTDLTVADLWKGVKDEDTLWGDISRESLRAVKCLLEHRMEDELTHYLKAASYTRSSYRRGYRNGSYVRRLTTTWGTLPLTVPRARVHGFTPSVLPRYQRRTDRVNTLVRSVFLGGVSTPPSRPPARRAARGPPQRHDGLRHHPHPRPGRGGLPPPAAVR